MTSSTVERLVVCLCLLAVGAGLAGCERGRPAPAADGPRATTPAPRGPELVPLAADASYTVLVGPDETIAEGSLVIANTGGAPAGITGAEPSFRRGGGAGVDVVGVKLLPLVAGRDTALAIRRAFPPDPATGSAWHDAVGATVEPTTTVTAYEVFIGLRVTDGVHQLSALRVTFANGAHESSVEFPLDTTLCAARAASAASC